MAWALPDIYSTPMRHGNARGKGGQKAARTVEEWARRCVDRAGERRFFVVQWSGAYGVKPAYEHSTEFDQLEGMSSARIVGLYDCRVSPDSLADDVRDLWRPT